MIRKIVVSLVGGFTVASIPTSGIREAMTRAYVPEFDKTQLFEEYGKGALGVYHTP
jgi:hypothetical protein